MRATLGTDVSIRGIRRTLSVIFADTTAFGVPYCGVESKATQANLILAGAAADGQSLLAPGGSRADLKMGAVRTPCPEAVPGVAPQLVSAKLSRAGVRSR